LKLTYKGISYRVSTRLAKLKSQFTIEEDKEVERYRDSYSKKRDRREDPRATGEKTRILIGSGAGRVVSVSMSTGRSPLKLSSEGEVI
jgi:hypothetical protein